MAGEVPLLNAKKGADWPTLCLETSGVCFLIYNTVGTTSAGRKGPRNLSDICTACNRSPQLLTSNPFNIITNNVTNNNLLVIACFSL
jgi:hypothetical protein